MLSQLSKEDRLSLVKFVCSFAWADLEVHDAERSFVGTMVKRLELDPEEQELVETWLRLPPRPEEVDPAQVPREHRKLFLEVIRELISADGEIASDEAETYAIFEDLL